MDLNLLVRSQVLLLVTKKQEFTAYDVTTACRVGIDENTMSIPHDDVRDIVEKMYDNNEMPNWTRKTKEVGTQGRKAKFYCPPTADNTTILAPPVVNPTPAPIAADTVQSSLFGSDPVIQAPPVVVSAPFVANRDVDTMPEEDLSDLAKTKLAAIRQHYAN